MCCSSSNSIVWNISEYVLDSLHEGNNKIGEAGVGKLAGKDWAALKVILLGI